MRQSVARLLLKRHRCEGLLDALAKLGSVVVAMVEKRSRGEVGFSESQRVEQDLTLTLRLSGASKGITHGRVHEERARWAYELGKIASGRDQHGGNAPLLQHSRDQTHGLVIEGSGGHQQCEVHLLTL
jgi:hypothetical protein